MGGEGHDDETCEQRDDRDRPYREVAEVYRGPIGLVHPRGLDGRERGLYQETLLGHAAEEPVAHLNRVERAAIGAVRQVQVELRATHDLDFLIRG